MPSGWPPLAAREPNSTSMAVAGVAGIVFRRSLLALLALGPVAVALDWFGAADKLTIFLLAAGGVDPARVVDR